MFSRCSRCSRCLISSWKYSKRCNRFTCSRLNGQIAGVLTMPEILLMMILVGCFCLLQNPLWILDLGTHWVILSKLYLIVKADNHGCGGKAFQKPDEEYKEQRRWSYTFHLPTTQVVLELNHLCFCFIHKPVFFLAPIPAQVRQAPMHRDQVAHIPEFM